MNQHNNLLDYKRGQRISASEVNAVLLSAYRKFNDLIPDNFRGFTTGQFIKCSAFLEEETHVSQLMLSFPNFCGMIDGANTWLFEYSDYAVNKVNAEADDILGRI